MTHAIFAMKIILLPPFAYVQEVAIAATFLAASINVMVPTVRAADLPIESFEKIGDGTVVQVPLGQTSQLVGEVLVDDEEVEILWRSYHRFLALCWVGATLIEMV